MRQLISIDKSGHIVGQFPHDPQAGFVARRNGLRRRLVSAKEAAQYDLEAALQIAQDRYALEEKRIREKQFVADESRRQAEYRRKNLSVADAADNWLKHVAVVASDKTASRYAQTIRLYLYTVGDHRLRDFSLEYNVRFYDALAKVEAVNRGGRPISAATQNMHMRHLSVFLHWAYDNELIDKLPRLKKAQPKIKEMEVFSVAQLEKLKAWLLHNLEHSAPGRPTVNARNLYRAFMLATNALLRKGAIGSLPLSGIDLDARLIRIRDVPELGWKNKASRWPNKPINGRLFDFLQADLAARGPKERWYLDDGAGNPWYADQSHISKAMTRACRAAGLPAGVKPFHWGMRAAMITWLLNDGEAPQRVQMLADHASITTTMRYFNTREASQKSAVERLPFI
ncbi:tyrosine-type recombinase/integrase [Oceanospirillaceae bacterium ASx5O]|nr:tyrosine-type recombinase/integrase [Oceanospirillaceae bacterium ASx5O]